MKFNLLKSLNHTIDWHIFEIFRLVKSQKRPIFHVQFTTVVTFDNFHKITSLGLELPWKINQSNWYEFLSGRL